MKKSQSFSQKIPDQLNDQKFLLVFIIKKKKKEVGIRLSKHQIWKKNQKIHLTLIQWLLTKTFHLPKWHLNTKFIKTYTIRGNRNENQSIYLLVFSFIINLSTVFFFLWLQFSLQKVENVKIDMFLRRSYLRLYFILCFLSCWVSTQHCSRPTLL